MEREWVWLLLCLSRNVSISQKLVCSSGCKRNSVLIWRPDTAQLVSAEPCLLCSVTYIISLPCGGWPLSLLKSAPVWGLCGNSHSFFLFLVFWDRVSNIRLALNFWSSQGWPWTSAPPASISKQHICCCKCWHTCMYGKHFSQIVFFKVLRTAVYFSCSRVPRYTCCMKLLNRTWTCSRCKKVHDLELGRLGLPLSTYPNWSHQQSVPSSLLFGLLCWELQHSSALAETVVRTTYDSGVTQLLRIAVVKDNKTELKILL